jgi:hypothetical protein
MKERIQPEMFENRHVNTHFNPKQQFLFMFKGEKTLNFTEYPFLLNLDYKNVTTDYYIETAESRNIRLTATQPTKRHDKCDGRCHPTRSSLTSRSNKCNVYATITPQKQFA